MLQVSSCAFRLRIEHTGAKTYEEKKRPLWLWLVNYHEYSVLYASFNLLWRF